MPNENNPDPAVERGEIIFASGTASSVQPRVELIPYEALVRLSRRLELGIERKGPRAWNALSDNFQSAIKDQQFVISRASHSMHHSAKLLGILTGQIPDDGDDHAAAIMWSGTFLAMVTKEGNKPL